MNPNLMAEVVTLCRVLQRMARFDEAHCVAVAVDSPSLCSSEYIRTGLHQAAEIAARHGLSEAAYWISKANSRPAL